ncbi:MAG TPA: acetate--CoA ligase family protein [Stellaceae bacterium]|nr:acetate--CoA ligase family protein [Stellaceae bacterium]
MPLNSAAEIALAQALFRPRAVALIGVSDDAGRTAGRPLHFLRKHGFAGPTYPINPNRDTVQGERAYKSLADVPGPVDHAYILVNTPLVEAAVAACAEGGVRAATILASGFAEAGAEGVALQRRLLEIARGSGLRLVGPNSLGVVDTHTPLALTANAAFAAEKLLKGRIAVLSQSGSQIGTFVSRGFPRGIGFSKLISVGNEADLSVGEIGAALAGDPETDAFLLFLETIREREHFARFGDLAKAAGKPIIAYRLGLSEVGRELAVSHTGAMVGSDAGVDAFLRRHGILRVDHLETLLEAPALVIGRTPPTTARRSVGAITTTGGGAAMVADRLGLRNVEVTPPSAETYARLKAAKAPALPGRMIDMTLAGTRPDIMLAALDILMEAPEFDLVLAVVGSSAQFHGELAVKPIIECARAKKPIAAFLVPHAEASLHALAENGVAGFRTPEACADAIAAYFGWHQAAPAEPLPGATRDRALAALSAASRAVLDERQSLALFDALDIAVAPCAVVDPERLAPLPFAFPVVAKVLSADITHKTDAGGVALGIASGEELAVRSRQMLASVRDKYPSASIAGILVQPMERGIGEALVGYRHDPQVGPVVTVGMGGTLAEVYRDFSVRLAPVSVAEAEEMLAEVRGFATLRGFRGAPAGDLAALASAVARLSELAALPGTPVLEAEINPLIVKAFGAVAVDGVVRLARP